VFVFAVAFLRADTCPIGEVTVVDGLLEYGIGEDLGATGMGEGFGIGDETGIGAGVLPPCETSACVLATEMGELIVGAGVLLVRTDALSVGAPVLTTVSIELLASVDVPNGDVRDEVLVAGLGVGFFDREAPNGFILGVDTGVAGATRAPNGDDFVLVGELLVCVGPNEALLMGVLLVCGPLGEGSSEVLVVCTLLMLSPSLLAAAWLRTDVAALLMEI
jgi:hypothetical protein